MPDSAERRSGALFVWCSEEGNHIYRHVFLNGKDPDFLPGVIGKQYRGSSSAAVTKSWQLRKPKMLDDQAHPQGHMQAPHQECRFCSVHVWHKTQVYHSLERQHKYITNKWLESYCSYLTNKSSPPDEQTHFSIYRVKWWGRDTPIWHLQCGLAHL